MPASKTEILLGSSWVDVTDAVRYGDGVSITSGQTGETGRIEPSVCNLTLDNRDGNFSPRNPTSPYYGRFVKGTHLRTSLQGPYMHLALNGFTSDGAVTPHTAVLAITGDLDVRVDASLHDWGDNGSVTTLIGKHLDTGNQRSWWLRASGGNLWLSWSPDGGAGTIRTAASTVPVTSTGTNRLAVRATLDVDNGAGGHTVTFYTAPTIAGPWTKLGDPVSTGVGTTTIYSSTAPVEIGRITGIDTARLYGMVYAAEVRNGIDGTVVANPDFTALSEGATGLTDGAGRAWTLTGEARITRYIPRFYGEINDIAVSGDQSGNDSVTQVQASDLTKRLGAASTPQISPIRQEMTNPERTGIVAYWPMEDETGSTSLVGLYSAQRMTYKGAPNFAQSTAWPGAAALPTAGTGVFTGRVSAYTSTNETAVRLLIAAPAGGISSSQSVMDLHVTGTASQWKVILRPNGYMALRAYNAEGTEILASVDLDFLVNGGLFNITLELTQSGSNVNWRLMAHDYTNARSLSQPIPGKSASGTLASYTVARVARVVLGSDGNLGDVVLGHVTVATQLAAYAATGAAIMGYSGENPNVRLRRLAGENGIPYQTIAHGQSGNTVELGRQAIATTMEIMREAADSDRGMLYASRSHYGFVYRSRLSLYNQDPVVALDCRSGHIGAPLQPVDDDQFLANKVTVNRAFGSSAVAELTDGALSSQDPPNGAGLREHSEDVSLNEDGVVASHANWVLHQRTVDEARYPSVAFKLHGSAYTADSELLHQMLMMRLGDRITITGQPSWLPPDEISQIVVGINESFNDHEHTLTVVCLPESTYHVAFVEGDRYERADTAGSQLAEDLTASATEADVLTTRGPIWVTAAPSLIANYDFASDLAGWTGNGATIERVPSPPRAPFHSGWALKLTPDGVAQYPNAGASAVPVTVGRSYTFSGWLMCETSRGCDLNLNWFGTGFTYMSTVTNSKTLVAGKWTWFEATAVAPAGSVYANISPTVSDYPPAADVLYAGTLTLRPTVPGELPGEFPLDVRTGGEVLRVAACTDAVNDTFTRATSNGWGAAEIGGAWTIRAGATADHSTSGTYGVHTQSTTNAAHLITVASPGPDVDLLCDVGTSVLATGASIHGGPVARCTDNNSLYIARLEFTTGAAINLTLRKRVGGTETQLATVSTGLAHTAGTFYRVRFQVSGTTLQAKAWNPATGAEPRSWQVTATDSDITGAANVGVRSFSSTGNTNTNPQVRIDSFRITNPQTFTVARSVNGVTKPHSFGADVRLAHPTYVSL